MQAKRGLLGIAVLLVAAAALPLGAGARGAGGTTITVNSLADTMSLDGQCTLREAILNANANKQKNADCAAGKGDDKIVFSAGGTINLTGELPAVQDLLTIDGGGDITIDGGGNFRIVTVTAKNAAFMNLVLTHGDTGGDGGAIQALGKSLLLDSMTLTQNSAGGAGGAVFSQGATLDVRNSTLESNEAGGGGAILTDGALTIQNSTVGNNVAEEGGAMLVNGSLRMESTDVIENEAEIVGAIAVLADAGIRNSIIASNAGNFPTVLVGPLFVGTMPISQKLPATKWISRAPLPPGVGKAVFERDVIAGNIASCFGGGIGAVFVSLTILQSTIVGNGVLASVCPGFGGGVAAETVDATIANSTITQNIAEGDGGGIVFSAVGPGPFAVTNSTIVDNEVDGATGAGGISIQVGQVGLTNTIVSGNDGGGDDSDCGILVFAPVAEFSSGGNNIDGDDTCNLTMPTDQPNTDPDLLPLFDWGGPTPTMPPDDGSPAVDTGGTPACKASPVSKHDQRGVTRPQGNQCDIGAVERVGDEQL